MNLYQRINDFDSDFLDDFTQKEIDKIKEYVQKLDVEIIKAQLQKAGKVNSNVILYMVYNNKNIGTIIKHK
jgi:hypothetical protein